MQRRIKEKVGVLQFHSLDFPARVNCQQENKTKIMGPETLNYRSRSSQAQVHENVFSVTGQQFVPLSPGHADTQGLVCAQSLQVPEPTLSVLLPFPLPALTWLFLISLFGLTSDCVSIHPGSFRRPATGDLGCRGQWGHQRKAVVGFQRLCSWG